MSPSEPAPLPARYVVLAAVDESASAVAVVDQASALVAVVPGAELHLAHVGETLGTLALPIGAAAAAIPSAGELLRDARARLAEHAASARTHLRMPPVTHLRVGPAWREIAQLATNLEADLLVIGTHDAGGFERFLLGSRTELIVRAAPCAVLVARVKVPHRSDVPEILPPCPECIAEQHATRGLSSWCARHAEPHRQAHTYSDQPESYGVGAQTFRVA